MPVGASIAATTAVQAGTSIANGVIGNNAAGAARNAVQTANRNDQSYLAGVNGQTQTNTEPFVGSGVNSTNALEGLLGVGGDPAAAQAAFKNYLGSTNYQFQLDQGLQGIEYANAPSFNSGATAKSLNNYAQGMAGNALAGYESLLGGQQQTGLNAANIQAQVGVGLANPLVSSNLATAGQIGNAAGVGAASTTSALNSLSKLFSSAVGQSSFAGSPGGGNIAGGPGNALAGASIGPAG